MNKQVLKQIKNVQVGDLMRVEWFDASTGKTAMGGPIDTPVKSWGVFLGVFGEKNKYIILAQNEFRMTDHGLYDVDYTAIPQSWTTNIHIIVSHELEPNARDRQPVRQKLQPKLNPPPDKKSLRCSNTTITNLPR